jgi:hypothetical protein
MQIFNIPTQVETWIEIDPGVDWEIHAANTHTRCSWTPFEGRKVHGMVRRVVLRGKDAFRDEQVLASPGSGVNIRPSSVKLSNHV